MVLVGRSRNLSLVYYRIKKRSLCSRSIHEKGERTEIVILLSRFVAVKASAHMLIPWEGLCCNQGTSTSHRLTVQSRPGHNRKPFGSIVLPLRKRAESIELPYFSPPKGESAVCDCGGGPGGWVSLVLTRHCVKKGVQVSSPIRPV